MRPPFVSTDGYAGFASRYIHDYGATKEDFGLIAINDRQHASTNEHAVLRQPLSMTDYLQAPMVRWPLSRLDMDMPIDGAEALVVTTAARARDLVDRPVYLHAVSAARTQHPNAMNTTSLEHHAQHATVSVCRRRSDLWLDDVDLLYAYDGFTIITLCWLESLGYCGPGDAGNFLRQHWDSSDNCVKIEGRVPMNSHGGNLSEGASQGAGDVREAVLQLRGTSGGRQVSGNPKVALLAIGGMYANATITLLRVD
jgi:acetyl-CoA acetyltransferase